MKESIVNWDAELMRFTVFFTDSPIEHYKTWWSTFTGKQADESRSKPSHGEYIDTGEFRNGILELRVTPQRADWILRPNGMKVIDIPSIGDFKEEIIHFKSAFISWLQSLTLRLNRVAFGAVLLNDENDRESGYKTLSHYLPEVPILQNNWREFNLQFNKPIVGKFDSIGEIEINRITNFSVVDMQVFTIQQQQSFVQKFLTRIEFDINTPVNYGDHLEVKETSDIFEVLTDIDDVLNKI